MTGPWPCAGRIDRRQIGMQHRGGRVAAGRLPALRAGCTADHAVAAHSVRQSARGGHLPQANRSAGSTVRDRRYGLHHSFRQRPLRGMAHSVRRYRCVAVPIMPGTSTRALYGYCLAGLRSKQSPAGRFPGTVSKPDICLRQMHSFRMPDKRCLSLHVGLVPAAWAASRSGDH